MKKEDIPQDKSALIGVTTEVTYAVDAEGKYVSERSTGWEVKTEALNIAWDDVERKIQEAKEKVMRGEASPILYFMEKKLMDTGILASYTGFWKWRIKKHLKPAAFQKLSEDKLRKYAELFEISIEELKKPF